MKSMCQSRTFARAIRVAFLLTILPVLLFLSGCGATQMAAGTAPAASAPTVAINATPQSVAAGAAVMLNVSATNATGIMVKGSDGSSYQMAATGGSQSVTPTATTTYTATATGAAGTTAASAQTVVTVTAPAPATVTLTANPASIAVGGMSVLTVVATNASSVTLTGSDQSTFTVQPTGGVFNVKPAATTTYTASAVGAAGSAAVTATAVVTVAPANGSVATVAISANPATVSAGLSSVITVTATNATAVTLTGTDGTNQTLQPTGGTFTVTPATPGSYTYTATATGIGGGTVTATTTLTVTAATNPTVTVTASPTTIIAGSSTNLVVSATNATSVTITSPGNPTYTLPGAGGTQTVSPAATTTYTATASGPAGTTAGTATATVTVTPAGSLQSVKHVVFLLQENHTFDNYFGMLNPYRLANNDSVGADGKTYMVDGIDDKLNKISNSDDPVAAGGPGDPPFSLFKFTSTCIDDLTSAWLESYGDVSRYDFSTTRPIVMDGFVHTAEGFANYCANNPSRCSGNFTDIKGKRSMGYYDEGFLNYYYFMASNFALSDRWFSPVSSKSVSNRIATYTGGTTQGLVSDPGNDDNLPQLGIPTFFSELNANHVSWKIYYTATNGGCTGTQDCSTLNPKKSPLPATDFSYFSDANNYIALITPQSPTCPAGMTLSTQAHDSSGSFCLDLNHLAPLSQYYTDLHQGTLPSYAFIEAGYGVNDEHPGSNQSILNGQQEVASLVNSLMSSTSWPSSVFFLAYDEGGGPYDHVPPVPGSSNINTDAMVGSTAATSIPDISTIAVAADGYNPCLPPNGTATIHCDLLPPQPGAHPGDAAAVHGFPAQLGFRVPNMVISPFTKKHFVSHVPMDHTAVLKFVEEVFIPNLTQRFTPRVAAQPDLTDFFDFSGAPWAIPPTPPAPVQDPNNSTCHAATFDQ